MTKVTRANVDGLYPPVYYATMSIFASEDVQASVMVMRIANSAFAVALITATFFALPRSVRAPLLISVVATAVPLGLFIYASTNPSSWALLSAATLWATLYGATQTAGRRRTLLLGLSLLAATIGAGARADAAVFAVFGAIVAIFLGVRSWRGQSAPLFTGVLIFGISAVFYLSARQGGAALGGLDPATGRLSFGQHLSNLLEVPALWTGALGQANLGWFDTRMPAAVWVLSTTVFAAALFIGMGGASSRRVIAIIVGLLAMWVVPFALLAQSNALVGSTVQPRYILPLLIIALGVASLRADIETSWEGLRFWLATACLSIGAMVALRQNIQRYTTGSDTDSIDPGSGAQWWWSGAPSPMFTWILGSVAFTGLLGTLWLAKKRPQETQASAALVQAPTSSEPAGNGLTLIASDIGVRHAPHERRQ